MEQDIYRHVARFYYRSGRSNIIYETRNMIYPRVATLPWDVMHYTLPCKFFNLSKPTTKLQWIPHAHGCTSSFPWNCDINIYLSLLCLEETTLTFDLVMLTSTSLCVCKKALGYGRTFAQSLLLANAIARQHVARVIIRWTC